MRHAYRVAIVTGKSSGRQHMSTKNAVRAAVVETVYNAAIGVWLGDSVAFLSMAAELGFDQSGHLGRKLFISHFTT